MPSILHIETSTKACSVALSLDGNLIFDRMNVQSLSHASELGVFVSEAMEYIRTNHLKLDAVAVSEGPGSYTGLRIGVSEAKGLCYGLEVPLIAIPSLEIITSALLNSGFANNKEQLLFCPMIDARRMEVYAAIYDVNINQIRSVQADIITEDSYKEYLDASSVVFFGDGSDKCKSIIASPNAIFVHDIHPVASAMIPLAEKAYLKEKFVNVAYFEPFYLKEFQATQAKNKVIRQLNNNEGV
ncbi:tRNA (adenosine(37)-N6)-threonylcarbamoyltransferase complex dimerization subunit type 1 TsaB [Bacteroidales bacterium OttesenSCG-928-M06]|nr:tRNA (adenosine(37)-N6)-threonylcarbamoyltransferase complex dimerization subunit type 1 TsaB [Bacteroidales bacterium OttesenSCG-928-M06]